METSWLTGLPWGVISFHILPYLKFTVLWRLYNSGSETLKAIINDYVERDPVNVQRDVARKTLFKENQNGHVTEYLSARPDDKDIMVWNVAIFDSSSGSWIRILLHFSKTYPEKKPTAKLTASTISEATSYICMAPFQEAICMDNILAYLENVIREQDYADHCVRKARTPCLLEPTSGRKDIIQECQEGHHPAFRVPLSSCRELSRLNIDEFSSILSEYRNPQGNALSDQNKEWLRDLRCKAKNREAARKSRTHFLQQKQEMQEEINRLQQLLGHG